jgi:hypothetical protein
MARRIALTLLVLLSTLTGTALAAHSREPQKRHNPADQARASMVRISRNDLGAGDWRVEAAGQETDSLGGCTYPDMSDLVETGKVENPNFSRNGSYVGSEGEVWATARDAETSWQRSLRFPFGACLTRALKQALGNDPRVKLTILSSGPLRTAKLAPRTFAYRMSFRVKGAAATITGRMTVYAFMRGRVDASLLVMSFSRPLQPVPLGAEQRLARVLAARVSR